MGSDQWEISKETEYQMKEDKKIDIENNTGTMMKPKTTCRYRRDKKKGKKKRGSVESPPNQTIRNWWFQTKQNRS